MAISAPTRSGILWIPPLEGDDPPFVNPSQAHAPTGDTVAVVIVLRIVARLAPAVHFGAAAACLSATVSDQRERFWTTG
jgi:hypothetical protein